MALAVRGSGAFTPERILQGFIYGEAVDERFSGKQSGLTRTLRTLKTAPYVHGSRPRSEGNQATIRDGITAADGVCVGLHTSHAVLVTANQHTRRSRERNQPE